MCSICMICSTQTDYHFIRSTFNTNFILHDLAEKDFMVTNEIKLINSFKKTLGYNTDNNRSTSKANYFKFYYKVHSQEIKENIAGISYYSILRNNC